jgi:hypothetical protein
MSVCTKTWRLFIFHLLLQHFEAIILYVLYIPVLSSLSHFLCLCFFVYIIMLPSLSLSLSLSSFMSVFLSFFISVFSLSLYCLSFSVSFLSLFLSLFFSLFFSLSYFMSVYLSFFISVFSLSLIVSLSQFLFYLSFSVSF